MAPPPITMRLTVPQLMAARRAAREFINYSWFHLFRWFEDEHDRVAATNLLLRTYDHYLAGLLPTRKEATAFLGVEHNLTAKRFIDLLAKQAFFDIQTSQMDARAEVLLLQPHQVERIEAQLAEFATDLAWANGNILRGKETDSPNRPTTAMYLIVHPQVGAAL